MSKNNIGITSYYPCLLLLSGRKRIPEMMRSGFQIKVPEVSSEVGPWFFSSRDHWRIQEYGGMQRIRTHTRVASGRRKQDPIQTHSFLLCRALRNNFFDAKTKRAVI